MPGRRFTGGNGFGRAGQEHGVHLPCDKLVSEPGLIADKIDLHPRLWFELHFLAGGEEPMNLLPRDVVVKLQITLGEQRQGCLKGTDRDFFADQVFRMPNPGIRVHPHLALAEQPAGKDWNPGQGHPPALRHQERGHGEFTDIEFPVMDHAAMPVGAVPQRIVLAGLFDVDLETVRQIKRAVEKRHVPVIAINRQ